MRNLAIGYDRIFDYPNFVLTLGRLSLTVFSLFSVSSVTLKLVDRTITRVRICTQFFSVIKVADKILHYRWTFKRTVLNITGATLFVVVAVKSSRMVTKRIFYRVKILASVVPIIRLITYRRNDLTKENQRIQEKLRFWSTGSYENSVKVDDQEQQAKEFSPQVASVARNKKLNEMIEKERAIIQKNSRYETLGLQKIEKYQAKIDRWKKLEKSQSNSIEKWNVFTDQKIQKWTNRKKAAGIKKYNNILFLTSNALRVIQRFSSLTEVVTGYKIPSFSKNVDQALDIAQMVGSLVSFILRKKIESYTPLTQKEVKLEFLISE